MPTHCWMPILCSVRTGSATASVLFLRGRNLLDEDARLHTSPLKDRLPLPGRSIGAGVRVEFGR